MVTSTAAALPAACEAEIAALTITSYGDAVAQINNGVRGKYLRQLDGIARSENLSDRLVADIGKEIAFACDREIALHAEISDRNHGAAPGWSSEPLSSLTAQERENL